MSNTIWGGAAQTALNWLFPPRCAGCGQLGTAWCDSCQQAVQVIVGPVCKRCGKPGSDRYCPACHHFDFAFDAVRSWAVYQSELRKAILVLKHRRNEGLALQFVSPLRQLLAKQTWSFDAIVPIPLGHNRLQTRGYNQVDLFAEPLAQVLGKPYMATLLTRRHATLPQFELDAQKRWENLMGSFVAGPEAAGQRVLLVDDIMTTGATLSAAAQALKAAGAEEVFAVTIARTMFEGDR